MTEHFGTSLYIVDKTVSVKKIKIPIASQLAAALLISHLPIPKNFLSIALMHNFLQPVVTSAKQKLSSIGIPCVVTTANHYIITYFFLHMKLLKEKPVRSHPTATFSP